MTPTARPARRRLAPDVRRRQVLDAAVAVFSEQGFHGASMDDVAARAGVSKPMVYAHGGSKDELFAACLRREAERLLRSVQSAVSGGVAGGVSGGVAGGVSAGVSGGATSEASDGTSRDPQTRLWLGLRAFFHALTTHRAGWTVLYRQASTGEFAGEVDALRGRIVAQTAALMADGLGMSPQAVRPYAHTLVGAAEGLADWWLTGGTAVTEGDGDGDDTAADSDTADGLARMLMSAAWPGLDALRSGRVWTPPAGIGPSSPVPPGSGTPVEDAR